MKLPAWVKALWKQEPVIIHTAVPALVVAGVFTAHEAALINAANSGVVSGVAGVLGLVGAWRARKKVTPAK
jgi:branched-subunit amino acid transport protein